MIIYKLLLTIYKMVYSRFFLLAKVNRSVYINFTYIHNAVTYNL
jgi:hypothetical protein